LNCHEFEELNDTSRIGNAPEAGEGIKSGNSVVDLLMNWWDVWKSRVSLEKH
jgi:hypothetical protein